MNSELYELYVYKSSTKDDIVEDIIRKKIESKEKPSKLTKK